MGPKKIRYTRKKTSKKPAAAAFSAEQQQPSSSTHRQQVATGATDLCPSSPRAIHNSEAASFVQPASANNTKSPAAPTKAVNMTHPVGASSIQDGENDNNDDNNEFSLNFNARGDTYPQRDGSLACTSKTAIATSAIYFENTAPQEALPGPEHLSRSRQKEFEPPKLRHNLLIHRHRYMTNAFGFQLSKA